MTEPDDCGLSTGFESLKKKLASIVGPLNKFPPLEPSAGLVDFRLTNPPLFE